MEEFPGNAKKDSDKQVTRVISGKVTRRRTPLTRRLADGIIGDNAKGVFEYVLFDVVLPAAKDVLADAVSSTIERLLYGEVRGTRSRRPQRNSSHISYNRYASTRYNPVREDRGRTRDSKPSFDDIVVESRAEAEEVIQNLMALIDQFDSASVSDLYELVGVTSDYTDSRWGWVTTRSMGVTRVNNGFLVDVPAPSPLN